METKNVPESALPDAAHSDPILMGWMVGSPPPKEKLVRFADGDMLKFPQNRWANCNYRSLVPTKNVSRGSGLVAPLPRADRPDLDAVSFAPIGSSGNMTWAESLSANYTDGIVVLHKGHIVYERYMGALDADTPHIAFSVTKSFIEEHIQEQFQQKSH